MEEFDRILVPVDDGKESEKAFVTALDLAERIDAEITLLHVMDEDRPVLGGVPTDLDEEKRKHGLEIVARMEQIAKGRKVEISPVLTKGRPSGEIVKMALDHDLIIMGTRGRSPAASLIMGSVAEKVTREACCPVMLVRERRESVIS